jgi:hypothetical protein
MCVVRVGKRGSMTQTRLCPGQIFKTQETTSMKVLSRLPLALMLFGTLAAGAVASAPPTFAGTSDPVSCNGFVQTYFKSAPAGPVTVPYVALTDDSISKVDTYTEGSLYSPGGTTLSGAGTQYLSTKRYSIDPSNPFSSEPFDPRQTQQLTVSLSYSPSPDASGRQLHVSLSSNGSTSSATPLGCLTGGVLYAAVNGYLVGQYKVVVVRLGAIDPVTIPK